MSVVGSPEYSLVSLRLSFSRKQSDKYPYAVEIFVRNDTKKWTCWVV